MSTLFVNNINTASGSTITIPTGKTLVGTDNGTLRMPGSVIQVVRQNPATDWSGSRWSSSSTSFSKGFMELTITPKATSSLIIIRAEVMGYMGASNMYLYHTIKRNVSGGSSTDLGLSTGSPGIVCNQTTAWETQHINYIDAPNTTSAITYELWHRNHQSNGTSYVGWQALSGAIHNLCFMELMEIAQ